MNSLSHDLIMSHIGLTSYPSRWYACLRCRLCAVGRTGWHPFRLPVPNRHFAPGWMLRRCRVLCILCRMLWILYADARAFLARVSISRLKRACGVSCPSARSCSVIACKAYTPSWLETRDWLDWRGPLTLLDPPGCDREGGPRSLSFPTTTHVASSAHAQGEPSTDCPDCPAMALAATCPCPCLISCDIVLWQCWHF